MSQSPSPGVGVRRRKPPRVIDQEENIDESRHRRAISWPAAACCGLLGASAILLLIYVCIPSPIDPVAFSLPTPLPFVGAMKPNTYLQKATRLYLNKVLGPESLVADGDYIYTGTLDGKIMVIYKGEVRELTRLGKEPCGQFEDEPTCGRPLGMRIDQDGYLIVADAYLGLFKVNVVTGDVFTLFPASVPINGKLPRFLNDLDIAKDGTIYLTDSSTRWDRRHHPHCFAEGEDSGRLLAYHPATNTTEELVGGIPFANGVQLTGDQTGVLVASSTLARIYRYNIQGPKKGQLEVFRDNLPGLPDNIRRSSSGGYWVGLAYIRQPSFSFYQFAASRPWLRTIAYKLFSPEQIVKILPKYGLIIHLNEEGEITRSLHDPSGERVPGASEVLDRDGVLYIGSFKLPFLSKLNINSIKEW